MTIFIRQIDYVNSCVFELYENLSHSMSIFILGHVYDSTCPQHRGFLYAVNFSLVLGG